MFGLNPFQNLYDTNITHVRFLVEWGTPTVAYTGIKIILDFFFPFSSIKAI